MKTTDSIQKNSKTVSIGKPMLTGATIGLILISIFLVSAGEPKAEWGKLWMIRPLILVSAAGALGGAFYFFMDFCRQQGGMKKVFANLLSLIVFIIGLWLGTAMGLDGTWWD